MAATLEQKQFTGKHMLASIVGFFAVIFAVNFLLAYLANSTWSGLVVENGYVASQSFGKDLEHAKTQEALGWQVSLEHGDGRISISFAGPGGEKLPGLTVLGQLRRPTTDKLDQQLTFASSAPGVYAAPVKLEPGVWEVEIDAADASGESYKKTYRFFVKG